MIDVQTIGVLIAAISVVIGVIFGVIQLRDLNQSRQAELFMQLYNSFHKTEFFDKFTDIITWKWVDYDDFIRQYGWKTNLEAWNSFGSVGAFFEGIGVLVHRNLIDVNLVSELMSRHIVGFWEKNKSISIEMRKRIDPLVDVYLEYLYDRVRPIAEQQRLELKT